MLSLDEREVLTDPGLLRVSLLVIGATLVGFLLATPLGLEPGAIALLGAASCCCLTARGRRGAARGRVAHAVLLVGLFMLVEAVVHVGIIDAWPGS